MNNYQPRGAFHRIETASATEPHAFGRLDLYGSNGVRLVGFPLDVIEGLERELRGDDGRGILAVRKYTNEKGERTAEWSLFGKPWMGGNISTDILLTVICGHLHKHAFQPTTGLPVPPKHTPAIHLCINFKRPLRIPTNFPKTQSAFAISLPSPTLIRTVSVPTQDEETILNEIFNLWAADFKDHRPLADGCYEVKLKTRGFFSSASSADTQTTLGALIEYLDSRGFPLIHSFPFHAKSQFPDFFLFDCPDGPLREEAEPGNVEEPPAPQAYYYETPPVVQKQTRVVKQDTRVLKRESRVVKPEARGPPTIQPKQGIMGRGLAFFRGRRSSNPTPPSDLATMALPTDLRSRHSLDSKRDGSSSYAGRAESLMAGREGEIKHAGNGVAVHGKHPTPSAKANSLLPGIYVTAPSVRSEANTPATAATPNNNKKGKGKIIEIEEERDVDSNAGGSNWGGFAGDPIDDGTNEPKAAKKDKEKGKEKEGKQGHKDAHKRAQDELPGIHQAMDTSKEPYDGGWGSGQADTGNQNTSGWGGADAGSGTGATGWGGAANETTPEGGGWGSGGAEPSDVANGGGWGASGASEGGTAWGGAESAMTVLNVETDLKSLKSAKSVDTSKTTFPGPVASSSQALTKKAAGEVKTKENKDKGKQKEDKNNKKEKEKEKGKSKQDKENRKMSPGDDPPNSYYLNNWSGPAAQSWDANTGAYQGGKGAVTATRHNPHVTQVSSKYPQIWFPSDTVRDMDPRSGGQNPGSVMNGIFVATQRPPLALEDPIVPGSKRLSGHGGLFGPNHPPPEIIEAELKKREAKIREEMDKLEESRKNALWAAEIARRTEFEKQRQLLVQRNNIGLVNAAVQNGWTTHHELRRLQQEQELQNQYSFQPAYAQQQQSGKAKKSKDKHANGYAAFQDTAYNGYSYDVQDAYGADVGHGAGGLPGNLGYGYSYNQNDDQKKKSNKPKKDGYGYGEQQHANGHAWPQSGQTGWSAADPQQAWPLGQTADGGWGTSAEPGRSRRGSGSSPHVTWANEQDNRRGREKDKKGKGKERNWRDEQLDPYSAPAQQQGAWDKGKRGAAEVHAKPANTGYQYYDTAAGGAGWGNQLGPQPANEGHTGWGNTQGDNQYGQTNWSAQEPMPSTYVTPNYSGWGGAAPDTTGTAPWGTTYNEGKQTVSKGRGLRGILKAFTGRNKDKSADQWGPNTQWNTVTAHDPPNVHVNVTTTHTQKMDKKDKKEKTAWGQWPAADGHDKKDKREKTGWDQWATADGWDKNVQPAHQAAYGPAPPPTQHNATGWGTAQPAGNAGYDYWQQNQTGQTGQTAEDQKWAAQAKRGGQQAQNFSHNREPAQHHAQTFYDEEEEEEDSYDDDDPLEGGLDFENLELFTSKLTEIQNKQNGRHGGGMPTMTAKRTRR